MSDAGLSKAIEKMRTAGCSDAAMSNFAHYYRLAEAGASGLILEDTIDPLTDPTKLADVTIAPEDAAAAMRQLVVIRLNGGLGTSMGLDRAKNLLPVREGLTFFDLIVRQIQHARTEFGARLPLIFMDSFRTDDDTVAFLSKYPDLAVGDLPITFLQNAELKLLADTLEPVSWPEDPTLEWCPPGHGDLYTALAGSGLLAKLLDHGFRYALVANGDNLGAVPDPNLAGWFASTGAPYAAEVCTRTVNDRKGGHLAIRKADQQLVLRDSAQTSKEDEAAFADETRHPYFHCNNLWMDLRQVADTLAARDGVLGLPLIRNAKTVDPANSATPKVLQLESAMGAAIEVFPGATAIAVPRSRFLPVKTTNELLLLRSDVYDLGPDGRLVQQTSEQPEVDLDPRYFKLIDDFDERMAAVPSLREAEALIVRGDVRFADPVTIRGRVEITGPAQLAALAAATRAESAESLPPSNRTILNADERRLIAEVPPHHGS